MIKTIDACMRIDSTTECINSNCLHSRRGCVKPTPEVPVSLATTRRFLHGLKGVSLQGLMLRIPAAVPVSVGGIGSVLRDNFNCLDAIDGLGTISPGPMTFSGSFSPEGTSM